MTTASCANRYLAMQLKSFLQRRIDDSDEARVALRVNPEVDVDTPHHYTRTGGRGHKFGIPHDEVVSLARIAVSLPWMRRDSA